MLTLYCLAIKEICYCWVINVYLKRIRELREDFDMKQIEVAELLGIKQPQYNRYETGKRDIPLDNLITLAKFYHVSTDYILELTNEARMYSVKDW